MSHVVSIQTQVHDLNAVKAACQELGLTFKENQKTIRWFGKWVNDYSANDAAYKLGISTDDYGKCDHAIEVPGSGYDVGLLKDHKTGGYRLYFDFYANHGRKIQEAIGKNGEKFIQFYAAHKIAMESKLKGYFVQRKTEANGHLKLTITT
jgi:hypothetical protein